MDSLPNLSDPSQWATVAVKTLNQPDRRKPIATQEFNLSSAICSVECQCFTAPESWHLAGWATALLAVDNSRSIIANRRLSLRESNLLVFPKSSGFYMLQVSFPRWIPTIRLIVKEFTGDDLREIDLLMRIESQLEGL